MIGSLTLLAGVVPSAGPIDAAYGPDGGNPNPCAEQQTVHDIPFTYGGGNWVFGRLQVRFSDPCDSVWTRVCRSTGWTGGSILQEAHRGASSAPGVGTYSATSAYGQTSSGTICGSTYAYNHSRHTAKVYTDCTEDFGTSCPTWGWGRLEAKSANVSYNQVSVKQTPWF